MDETARKLQAPFEPSAIEWRVGSTTKNKDRGLALAYVTNRAIQDRLDEVFGPFNWRNEYIQWKGTGQLCGISVLCPDSNQWITKWDGADDSEVEATKGGLSDSMKRAAYQWGIGRYLYKLPPVWAPLKPQGRGYVFSEVPKLPTWALPEGHSGEHKATIENAKETFPGSKEEPEEEPKKGAKKSEPKKEAPKKSAPKKSNGARFDCAACKGEVTQSQKVMSEKKCNGQVLCPSCRKKEEKKGDK